MQIICQKCEHREYDAERFARYANKFLYSWDCSKCNAEVVPAGTRIERRNMLIPPAIPVNKNQKGE